MIRDLPPSKELIMPASAAHLLRQELKIFLPWHQARLDCLAHLMLALIQVRTVNLTQRALAFDVAVKAPSVYQRLKRFFRHHVFETDVVAVLVTQWLDLGERWVLCLDRTNWPWGCAPVSLRVLSVAYRGISVPLLWTALDKKGMSATNERIAWMERFLAIFSVARIDCLTANREFRGHDWLAYLIRRNIPFRLRIPNNTITRNRHRNARLPITRLFSLQIGETLVLNRARKLWGHTLYRVGTHAVGGSMSSSSPCINPKPPWRMIGSGGKQNVFLAP